MTIFGMLLFEKLVLATDEGVGTLLEGVGFFQVLPRSIDRTLNRFDIEHLRSVICFWRHFFSSLSLHGNLSFLSINL